MMLLDRDDDPVATEDHDEEQEEKEGSGGESDCAEEQSMDAAEQAELLIDWAATAIQATWKVHLSRKHNHSLRTEQPQHKAHEICCACFAALPAGATNTTNDTTHTSTNTTPLQLFCVQCKYALEHGRHGASSGDGISSSSVTTSSNSMVSSPLPKLSLLVQTEAKYQDQLRLLRQQQELLAQQQHEIELRKKLQLDAQEIAKRLARQRRRQFQQQMARRQAEENQKLQELVGDRAEEPLVKRRPRPRVPREQPGSSTGSSSGTTTTTASTPPLIEPGQLRRHRIPAPPLPSAMRQAQDASAKAVELVEKARRKQKIETMKCYAQDLTPLVHGQRPKKLPVPAATATAKAPAAAVPGTKKTSQKRAKPSKITLVPLNQQQQQQQQAQKMIKSTKSNNNAGNNQTDQQRQRPQYYYGREEDDAGDVDADSSGGLRVLIPRRTGYQNTAPTPLTAEIKPVSWMYELLSSDPVLSGASHNHTHSLSSQSAVASILVSASHVRSQLTTLHEDLDERDERHRSYSGGGSGNGQRVTLAPLASSSSIVSDATTTVSGSVPAVAVATPPLLHREYTSERLASLLEKYNISVSVAIPTTTSSIK